MAEGERREVRKMNLRTNEEKSQSGSELERARRSARESEAPGSSDELWRTIELCWSEDHDVRPVVEILSCLHK
jgi:hypothetical protein